jgi:hypothetical protein
LVIGHGQAYGSAIVINLQVFKTTPNGCWERQAVEADADMDERAAGVGIGYIGRATKKGRKFESGDWVVRFSKCNW